MVSRREDSDDASGARAVEDLKHSTIQFRGTVRHVVDIRPLEDYGREMDKPTKCPVCSLPDGNHDLRKHRLALDAALDKSISNHPAGKRRKPKDDDNG